MTGSSRSNTVICASGFVLLGICSSPSLFIFSLPPSPLLWAHPSPKLPGGWKTTEAKRRGWGAGELINKPTLKAEGTLQEKQCSEIKGFERLKKNVARESTKFAAAKVGAVLLGTYPIQKVSAPI